MSEQFYDVIVYEKATGIVASIIGRGLPRAHGYDTAEKRLETVRTWINDAYGAMIAEISTYAVGDTIPDACEDSN